MYTDNAEYIARDKRRSVPWHRRRSWSREKSATMLPKACKVISPEEVRQALSRRSSSPSLHRRRKKRHTRRVSAFLVHLIRREVQRCFGTDKEQQVFVGDDWWPNHTRYIEAIPDYCTAAFFTALRRLLTDDYKSYRIQVCVWRDLLDEKSFIGSMVLTRTDCSSRRDYMNSCRETEGGNYDIRSRISCDAEQSPWLFRCQRAAATWPLSPDRRRGFVNS